MTPAREQLLALRQVTVSFQGFVAVDRLDLAVASGELRCLIGPNGAGKSTTLDLICGKSRITSGEIVFRGAPIHAFKEFRIARTGIGRKFQVPSVFRELTVRENLKLGYDASGCAIPFETRLELIHDMFPRIRERMNQQANTMSGGEQAMVALARALIGDPEMLVMDEPSLGLSPKLIDEYFETVVRIHAEGKTVLLIEQNAETALSISDRGYLLVRGRIAVSGTRAEMLRDDTIRHMYL